MSLSFQVSKIKTSIGNLKFKLVPGFVAWTFFLILVSLYFTKSDFASLLRPAAILPALQLSLGLLIFALVGKMVSDKLKISCFNISWLVLIGQLSTTLWVYLRSGFNFIFEYLMGLSLPLSIFDFLLIPLFAFFLYGTGEITSKLRGRVTPLLLELIPLLLICWLCAQRELPRLSMLSSDPDLHVFWAAQLQRLGTIPSSLELWGPEALRYPAGFAVLNFLWSSFTLLDLQQVVSAQSLLQTQLAIVLIVSTCSSLLSSGSLSPLTSLGIKTFVICFYFFLLPYGYQVNFFHLEGTARTSCLQYLAVICLGFSGLFVSKGKLRLSLLWITATTCTILIGISPANALYAAPCLALCLVFSIWLAFFERKKCALAIWFSPLLLICDPYFLSSGQVSSSLAVDQTTLFSSLVNGAINSFHSPIESLKVAYSNYFTVDFYPANKFQIAAFVLLILYLLVRLPFRNRGQIQILALTLPLLILILLAFVIIPGIAPLSTSASYRLLFPYTLHLSQQLLYLWAFFILSIVSCCIFKRIGFNALVALSLPVLLFLLQFRESSTQIRFEPRHSVLSGMGSPSPDDFKVIYQIEDFTKDIHKKYPNLDAATIPKILVPNFLSDLGWEQWLFPYGGSRVLHLHEVLPLAFYYNQGWQDFSYQNYRNRICKRFDLQWLQERNVRYLFLPSERGPICIRGLEKLASEEKILFRSGNSVFLKLY